MKTTSETQRRAVWKRATNRCEAQVLVKGPEIWCRCFQEGIEVHHMLTRARGGDLLDLAGEVYHLVGLCPRHHRDAHAGASGYAAELMIEGYVLLDSSSGEIYYDGPDSYLLATYGRRVDDHARRGRS